MTDGAITWSYTYDANGMRTQRSNGTTAYSYVYNGSQLSQMTVSGNTLNFAYDASGVPMMVTYNGTNYYYIVNLQGDVKGIVDSTGTLVVYYTYDAWGKPLSITGSMANTLGVQNPLRYRGYVYDQETGLYYLQSRYYDPEIGRFINADAFPATGQGFVGNNMFAYCGNNPVNRVDHSGHSWIAVLAVCVIVALLCPSSENQAPYYSAQAQEKYNKDTVSVYERGDPSASKKSINAEIYYPSDGVSNISIDKSLEITSGYEMDAVLDVITESEYYSEDVYGSKKFMKAQWVAHNVAHSVASSGDLGYWIMQTLSGSANPTTSASSLDLRSTNNLLLRQRVLYTIISWVC